ncbi:MAG: SAM-dependent methyltransferase [Deltaproteobacteria bacterium]|nr:MAG: SAM-dependent methyltransferase [Deltaproteobacteria bacterium]
MPGFSATESPSTTTTTPHHAVLLLATSASVLAYEILIMRLLSIGQWHHFAYMAISMALLGFGAAGSMLFLLFKRMRKNLEEWLLGLAAATAVSFCLCFSLSQKVGLDPLLLIWQPSQWLFMLLTYLLMAVPFLLAGGIVGIILTGAGERAHRMYAVDLLGAGCGALAIVPALYLGPPWTILPALGCLVLMGALWCGLKLRRPRLGGITLLVAAGAVTMVYVIMPPVPKIHHTKALPMTLSFPDARIEAKRVGPLGMIDVVGSDLIRHVPGLSLNFGLKDEGPYTLLPKQKAIFTDADAPSPISRFTGNLNELIYLDFTTMALPYHIRQPESLLVVGAGGGTDVLLGLRHHTPVITALEANQQIAGLLQKPFAEFSGHIYAQPEVRLKVREARQFLHATDEQFDLIQLSLLDSFVTSAGGLHSATESYLYTREAIELYLSRLTGAGVLAITRWLKLPPRDSLRVISTALSAMRRMGLFPYPEKHLLFIRSWKTSTILVSKAPFTREEIARATKFCDERSFDLAYYAGMEMERANRYDVQASPQYFIGAKALSGQEAESFFRRYVFDVSATTDDRPFFSSFFRWDKAPTLIRQLRREWLPMVEMGYVFILATLVQAVLASGVLILLPLFYLRRVQGRASQKSALLSAMDIFGTLSYFACIGLAFMFLEMALLPKFTLLLSHPVYSAAVVLSTLLVFAGCGSLSVRRFQSMGPWFLWIAAGAISLWVFLHGIAGDQLFHMAMGWSFGARVVLSVLLLSWISFFLGWPFPTGLGVMARQFPNLVPWAWGINGCASVIGAVLGKCLAVSIGFRWLMFSACVLYFLAIIIFYAVFRNALKE